MRIHSTISRLMAALGLAMLAFASPVFAQAQSEGEKLVRSACGGCHAIGRDDQSTHPQAPAFRDLHERYPPEALEEALAEGILVGHPDMPAFVATPDQIGAIIGYLRSLAP